VQEWVVSLVIAKQLGLDCLGAFAFFVLFVPEPPSFVLQNRLQLLNAGCLQLLQL